jgi:hypothetical protein
VLPLAGSRSEDTAELGVALEWARIKPLSTRTDVSFRMAWGLTTWDRFRRWSRAAYGAGAWTTEAYRNVYGWMGPRASPQEAHQAPGEPRKDSDPTRPFRLIGGSMAMVFLSLGYVTSGFLYAASLVAPSTWVEIDGAVHYNLGDKDWAPYLKGGLGALAFLHPRHGSLVGGIGPHFGGGVRVGSFLHLGLSATWSPPYLHGEFQDGRTHLLVTSLTLGTQD